MKRPPPSPRLGWRDLRPRRGPVVWRNLPGAARVRLTYSGRGAIYQYLAALRRSGLVPATRNVVLVPAFHCPNVVDPVLHAGFDVRFYAIDGRLRVDAADFLRKLDGDVAVALFIQYFGFPGLDPALASASRQAGARVLEDCSHSFLYAAPLRLAQGGADATTFSFWKLLPGKTGGGLALGEREALDLRLQLKNPDLRESWSRSRMLLGQVRDELAARRHDAAAGAAERLPAEPAPVPAVRLSAAEAYPYDPEASNWKMPAVSRLVLHSADLAAVVAARRRNYATYVRQLAASPHLDPIHAELPDDVCPWGLPVILQRRGERDYLIRARGVPVFTFGEVLHPLLFERHATDRAMLEQARFLSDNLLALSLYQGIGEEQVRAYAAIVNEFVAGLGAD